MNEEDIKGLKYAKLILSALNAFNELCHRTDIVIIMDPTNYIKIM